MKLPVRIAVAEWRSLEDALLARRVSASDE